MAQEIGHLNYRSLGHMSSKNLVYEIPKIMESDKSCDICMRGQQPRFQASSEAPPRETRALDVVHSNVCGSFEVHFIGGNKYFVSFVYEFTIMT